MLVFIMSPHVCFYYVTKWGRCCSVFNGQAAHPVIPCCGCPHQITIPNNNNLSFKSQSQKKIIKKWKIQKYKNTKIQKFKIQKKIQKYKSTKIKKIQKYKSIKIQKYKNAKIQKYKKWRQMQAGAVQLVVQWAIKSKKVNQTSATVIGPSPPSLSPPEKSSFSSFVRFILLLIIYARFQPPFEWQNLPYLARVHNPLKSFWKTTQIQLIWLIQMCRILI